MDNPFFIVFSSFVALTLLTVSIMLFVNHKPQTNTKIQILLWFNKLAALAGILYAMYLMATTDTQNVIAAISWALLSISSHLLSEKIKSQNNQTV